MLLPRLGSRPSACSAFAEVPHSLQAQHIKENLKPGQPHKPLSGDAGAATLNNLDWVRNSNGNRTVADLRLEMQKVMQSDAAVFRTEESVRTAGLTSAPKVS